MQSNWHSLYHLGITRHECKEETQQHLRFILRVLGSTQVKIIQLYTKLISVPENSVKVSNSQLFTMHSFIYFALRLWYCMLAGATFS